MVTFESKSTRHPATTSSRMFEIHAHPFEQLHLTVRFHDGAMMAVAVHQRFAIQVRDTKIGGVFHQEITERERQILQSLRILVLCIYLSKLVSKIRRTVWLKSIHSISAFT